VVDEGAVGGSSSLTDRAQPAVLEMEELFSRTNADSPNNGDTGTKLNTALHRPVVSLCGNSKNRAGSYRQLDNLMANQNLQLNMPNKEGYMLWSVLQNNPTRIVLNTKLNIHYHIAFAFITNQDTENLL